MEPGRIGEIWPKGPGITPGYWQRPAETARTFVDGWFRTGDLGRVDREGYYYLSDRIKNIIISGWENISPQEVESIINAIEGVVESSVVGIEDDTCGERVVAAVVPGYGTGREKDPPAPVYWAITPMLPIMGCLFYSYWYTPSSNLDIITKQDRSIG